MSTPSPERPPMPGRPTPVPAEEKPAAPVSPVTRPAMPTNPSGPVSPPSGPVSPPAESAPPVRGPVSAPAASEAGVHVTNTANAQEYVDVIHLLTHLYEAGGSDLHLTVGAPPSIRLHGEILPIPNQPRLTNEGITNAINTLMTPTQRERFETEHELDFAYMIKGVSRFRGNVFRQRHSTGAVFRVIPWDIKPLEALGLPPVINNFAALPRGLVLITGPTGSGKSTTLAALVDKANRTRNGHIVTVEDPIEFLHSHRGCIVNQREVGEDTLSFTAALKHVLRQDPDIILIGELRDLETISIALTAAETGHLVFATLHTQSANDTVNRLIDVFPGDQQDQIRNQVASTLKGVVCQALIPSRDGQGRTAAAEIMIVTNAISTMIRRGEIHQIPQALQSSGQQGMMTLNQSLANLVAQRKITREAAEEYASDLADLDALLAGAEKRLGSGSGNISFGGLGNSSL